MRSHNLESLSGQARKRGGCLMNPKKNQYVKGIIFALILAFFCSFSITGIEETITLKKPFVVRRIKGRILTKYDSYWGTDPDIRPVFELTGPGDSSKTYLIKVDKYGRFNHGVSPGTYKFYIRILGWDDAAGTIIVTKKAKKNAKILIVVGLS
jgi:hypothetical protein